MEDKTLEVPSFMQGETYKQHLEEAREAKEAAEKAEADALEAKATAKRKRKQVAKVKKVGYTVFIALATMLISTAAKTGKEVVVGTEMLKRVIIQELESNSPYYLMNRSDGFHFYKDGTSEEVPFEDVISDYRSRLDKLDLTDAEKVVGLAALPGSVEHSVFDPEGITLADKCAAARARYQYEMAQEQTEEYEGRAR